MFGNGIKKIKKNAVVRAFFFNYIQRTGFTCVEYNGQKIKSFFLLGREIIPKYKCDNETIDNGTLVYFKVNRDSRYSIECINRWINTVSKDGMQYIFICDNDSLKYQILRQCDLNSYFRGFLKSDRKGLKQVAKYLYTGNWEFATYAHLTPFYHAKSIGKKKYWCIDADDTMFLIDSPSSMQVLKKAENISIERSISAFSLDMWRSKTFGKHWSLGVLFINDNVSFCDIFNGLTSNNWIEELKVQDDSYNLDWFFSYLKAIRNYNIQTFYVENATFIHWSDDLYRNNSSSWVCTWHENKIIYPILRYVYGNEKYGCMNIADCIKIDIGLMGSEYPEYMIQNSDLYLLSNKRRELLGIL